jgi:hypothetical protein
MPGITANRARCASGYGMVGVDTARVHLEQTQEGRDSDEEMHTIALLANESSLCYIIYNVIYNVVKLCLVLALE